MGSLLESFHRQTQSSEWLFEALHEPSEDSRIQVSRIQSELCLSRSWMYSKLNAESGSREGAQLSDYACSLFAVRSHRLSVYSVIARYAFQTRTVA